MWWHWLIAALVYLIFKEKINAKIKEIKGWLDKNKDLLEKWQSNAGIMGNYRRLKEAIEDAQIDKRWDVLEILNVIGLAVTLLKSVEEIEKGGE